MKKFFHLMGFTASSLSAFVMTLGLMAFGGPQKSQAEPVTIICIIVVGGGLLLLSGCSRPTVPVPVSAPAAPACATVPGTTICAVGATCASSTTAPCACRTYTPWFGPAVCNCMT